MDADKALERINLMLLRTEAAGASPAEEDTAARMVCKLLRNFPELLQGGRPARPHRDVEQPRYNSQSRPPYPGNKTFTVRYSYIKRQNDKAILVQLANGKEVWLPLSQIVLKTETIWMPLWLAQAKGLA